MSTSHRPNEEIARSSEKRTVNGRLFRLMSELAYPIRKLALI